MKITVLSDRDEKTMENWNIYLDFAKYKDILIKKEKDFKYVKRKIHV